MRAPQSTVQFDDSPANKGGAVAQLRCFRVIQDPDYGAPPGSKASVNGAVGPTWMNFAEKISPVMHRGKIPSRNQVEGQKFLENGEIVKVLAQFRRRPVSALFQRESATHLPTVYFSVGCLGKWKFFFG